MTTEKKNITMGTIVEASDVPQGISNHRNDVRRCLVPLLGNPFLLTSVNRHGE